MPQPAATPALRIRDAAEADLPALGALLAETARFHAAARPDLFAPVPDAGLDLAYLGRYFIAPDARIFVAEEVASDRGDDEPSGGRGRVSRVSAVSGVIGMVQCVVRHAPQREILVPRAFVHVEEVSVTASARGRGVGRALMARAEDWARERGIATIELNVFSFNTAAQRLYEDLGYRTSSRILRKQLGPVQPAQPLSSASSPSN